MHIRAVRGGRVRNNTTIIMNLYRDPGGDGTTTTAEPALPIMYLSTYVRAPVEGWSRTSMRMDAERHERARATIDIWASEGSELAPSSGISHRLVVQQSSDTG